MDEPQVEGGRAVRRATNVDGLSTDEARARLATVGPNEIVRGETTSALKLLASQFGSPLIWLLLAASAVSAFLGETTDAIAIGTILVINAFVGFFQEYRAEKAMLALRSMTAPRARVRRGGHAVTISAPEVVPGDVLILDAGDIVAADAFVMEAHALSTNEASLTGESTPVDKGAAAVPPNTPLAERHDSVFMGTSVATGSGFAEVAATGMLESRTLPFGRTFASTMVALAVIAGAFGDSAGAQETLQLPGLLKAIRERSPAIAGSGDRRDAARIRIARARAFDDPLATAMIEDVPPSLRGGMPMVRLQATQMLPWPGKRDRMATVAERETDAAAARVDTTVLDAVTQGKRLYHQLYLNAEARRINRDQRAIVDALVAIANGRLGAGVGGHHDVLKMQTEATMLDDNLVMLRADRVEMAAMVNALIDRPASTSVGEPLALWSPPFGVDREKLVGAAFERRPELREMAAMSAAEHAMADVARREYYPDVMVGGLYDARMGSADTIGAMVGINLPIWVGSKQRLDVEAAEARGRAVVRERAAMAAMVRAEIERGLSRIETAERRIRLIDDEFIPRAQQTFDSALKAFPAGMMSVLELLDALRVVTNQRLARVALAIDREIAIVDLERAIGVPPGEIR